MPEAAWASLAACWHTVDAKEVLVVLGKLQATSEPPFRFHSLCSGHGVSSGFLVIVGGFLEHEAQQGATVGPRGSAWKQGPWMIS